MVYGLIMGRKEKDNTTKKKPVSSVTPTIGTGKVKKKAAAAGAAKTTKYRMSASESKRELAMQKRGTGKKVGPKATAQRIAAKRVGKSIKKQEVAMAKRGKK